MLVKVDSLFVPALSLAMFLDYAQVSFDAIIVEWGNEIRIPATGGSLLEQDVRIPIDNQGRAFISYPQEWGEDFEQMTAHSFLKLCEDENLQGDLAEYFEAKFVFIADVSSGIGDLGQTPLDEEAPLICMHTALLNGLLSHSFYEKWSFGNTLSLVILAGMLMGVSARLRFSWIMYLVGGIILAVILGVTWTQMSNYVLVPVASLKGSSLYIFFGLLVGLQVAISRERAVIRSAFSR
ncbi:CHASE2 domain-containing protein [candidate division KSB1 bacterium]|nr:CHASE2 domain-containing protein [candidate division KSB1 bacterium]NIR71876.1 CHASE2 domain-containing protein [candidate division KSB1 bacterium]NIS26443.1 CHASE2 domain-containing protein [candidate division KSB1 bacterium]NIT73213.1 CHASE2 domain-containing protein [candidate division KSB1 bacterium]NIU27127.1 CHASE2 domain-containing protein [candidate division KSB1 bacterium]